MLINCAARVSFPLQLSPITVLVRVQHEVINILFSGSLLATRLLYTGVPKCLLAFGAGAQISAHISLFLTYYPSISSCVVFNRSRNARLLTLISSLAKTHPDVQFRTGILPAYASSSDQSRNEDPDDADLYTSVQEADIIVTATSSMTPLFPSAYVKSGAHLSTLR